MKPLRRLALVLFFAALPLLVLAALLLPQSSFSARPSVYLFLGLGAAGGLALPCGAALWADMAKKSRQRMFTVLFICCQFPPLLLLLTLLASPLIRLCLEHGQGAAFLTEQALFDMLGTAALLLTLPALALAWLWARCCLKKLCQSPWRRAKRH